MAAVDDKQMAVAQGDTFYRPSEGRGWKSLPELPTPEEILAEENPDLPGNPVDVPWASKDLYLEAQYRLLRCDAVEGLRYAVRHFIERCRKAPSTPVSDDDFICVYNEVRVKGYLMTRNFPVVNICFSSMYQINWRNSKRLLPGSIMAITTQKDQFRSICKIATVAQRLYTGGLDQDPPLVDLIWANPEDAVIDPNLELIMVESRHSFFEAARYVLKNLQRASEVSSPLDKYLTGHHSEDTVPNFILENPVMNLSCLIPNNVSNTSQTVQAFKSKLATHNLLTQEFPDLQDTSELDESQLEGLRRMLTNELAIVQGPPGTGKTFTSIKFLEVAVANQRKYGGPPIIVSAHTNHALDQLLAHCLHLNMEVLRVGGQTKSEELRHFTLYRRRQHGNFSTDAKTERLEKERRQILGKIQRLVEHEIFGDRLVDRGALLEAGIITQEQHDSLVDETMNSSSALEHYGAFGLWLDDSRIRAKVLQNRWLTRFELEESHANKLLPEIDYDDDEELFNIADDEDEQIRFKGKYLKLEHVWSGKPAARLSSSGRAVSRALKESDLFAIEKDLRGAVYQHFQAELLQYSTKKFSALLGNYIDTCKRLKVCRDIRDVNLVTRQGINIIGCTTTGLTKYRGFLEGVSPRTILIEEAAETRESDIVSGLYPSVQQLVLVGDHQQLTPKCNIQWLSDPPYNITTSLFQRMVNLDVPFTMLRQQRRMRPELRHLLQPFYPDLSDHPVVLSLNNRPHVPGMGGHNLWLYDHGWPEQTNNNNSKFNELEAGMVVRFYAYLVANGIDPSEITILTFYNGQRKLLMTKLRRHPSLFGLTKFNVFTIDSYQGEENDIVLLSLVRSPEVVGRWQIGFLEDEHRAVVAISRARLGLYMFGNIENAIAAGHNWLWTKIWNGFSEQEAVRRLEGLPLTCQKHGRETWIKTVDDWGDNAGGCDQRCEETRPCGHPCSLKCHFHPCVEQLFCGHGCQRRCSQKCYCDCVDFQNAQMQYEARERPSLSQAATRQTLSTAQRGAQRFAQGNLGGRGGSRHTTEALPGWQNFSENPHRHDEEAAQTQTALVPFKAPITTVREVYQSVALVKGRRVEGDRTTQQFELGKSSVSGHEDKLDTPVETESAAQAMSPSQTSSSGGLGLLVDIGEPVESEAPVQHVANMAPMIIPGITRDMNSLVIRPPSEEGRAEEDEGDLIQF
ncbi:putative helicase [Podospora australis]|uniref:Helicase n=1 Tax=Podospora australis TaxID=1536484 RepID=A0AAN6WQ91_9PEZI|nr:putative helicase [Podospora australis]